MNKFECAGMVQMGEAVWLYCSIGHTGQPTASYGHGWAKALEAMFAVNRQNHGCKRQWCMNARQEQMIIRYDLTFPRAFLSTSQRITTSFTLLVVLTTILRCLTEAELCWKRSLWFLALTLKYRQCCLEWCCSCSSCLSADWHIIVLTDTFSFFWSWWPVSLCFTEVKRYRRNILRGVLCGCPYWSCEQP